MYVQNGSEIPAHIAPTIGNGYTGNGYVTNVSILNGSIAADAYLRGRNVLTAVPSHRQKRFIGSIVRRPLLFYGALGLLLLLVGITCGIWTASIYRHMGQLAIGYALISALLCMVGHLALTAGIILHSMRSVFPPYLPNRRQILIIQESAHADSHQK